MEDETQLHEVQALAQLEKAAEKTKDPAEIKSEAQKLALEEQSAAAQPERAGPKVVFTVYLSLLAVFAIALFLLHGQADRISPATVKKWHRYFAGALGIVFILALYKSVALFAVSRMRNPVSRFNLGRILRLLVGLIIAFIVISVLFVDWYTAVVSLGLISLVLGFALQTPISSFIGWIYILIRQPYRVGDRIEIGEARGDVIDVSYLDTTLWEIGGRHLSTDHPSGRLIKFPNTNVFNSPVFNYSWPVFPYIWNEIKFSIAYESDLEFVAHTMQQIAEEEVGESMMEKVRLYRDLLARTPVDHLEVKERPVVVFRVNPNTWVDAIVRYIVPPREAGRVKTALTRKMLVALNAAPDRVLFPKSNLR